MASECGIKREAVTIGDKLEILKIYDVGFAAKKKQKGIACEVGIHGSTLPSILNEMEKNTVEGGCKCGKVESGKYEDLEGFLVEGIYEIRAQNLLLNSVFVIEKAKEKLLQN